MKIQLASDLHLERILRIFPGERLITPAPEADLLVLAGDVANGIAAVELFRDWPVPVLYVAGSHEFYGRCFERVRDEIRQAAQNTAIRFLDNEVAEFGGVRFLGSTLWTDYRLNGDWSQGELMLHAERSIDDHRQIRTKDGLFTAARALYEHEKSRKWLQRELETKYGGKTVIVTHHGPHPKSIHPQDANGPANATFVSALDDLLIPAQVWLHGHVHDSVDYIKWGCHVIANPLGYARNCDAVSSVKELKFENPSFGWTCVIDLTEPGE